MDKTEIDRSRSYLSISIVYIPGVCTTQAVWVEIYASPEGWALPSYHARPNQTRGIRRQLVNDEHHPELPENLAKVHPQ